MAQSPARIAIVTETFAPEVNGVANTLKHLCMGLMAAGHTLDLVRPRQQGEPAEGHPSLTSHCLVTRGLPLPGYPDLRFGLPASRQLRARWQSRRPDAVYIATQGPLGWSALKVARALKIPVTTGFHTNFQQYSRFYRAGFLESLIRRYLVNFHNRSQRTLVPTRSMQQTLKDWGIRQVGLWSRGVDCQQFSPWHRSDDLRRPWRLQEGGLAVIYVGRLAAEKNLSLAVASFERLQAIHRNARFILVGDGPLRQGLQARHPDYLFAGMQTGSALATYYASGDIFLFPSQSDTFGNVVTEAMASGLGVVAFDDAAAREHIHSGSNGLKVPLHDSEGFIHAAMRLADQPSLLQRVRQGARQTALTLDWQDVTDSFARQLLTPPPEARRHGTKQSIPLV
ncbi:MAG: glycosyltransferase family 1 protein [Halomonadaceae bacterium]|nr:MAG: glycosyltransferase family 1 protein [Halomonadaceae bacterium]